MVKLAYVILECRSHSLASLEAGQRKTNKFNRKHEVKDRSLLPALFSFLTSPYHKDLEQIQRRHQLTSSRDYLAAFEGLCAARLILLIQLVCSPALSRGEVTKVSFQKSIKRLPQSRSSNYKVKTLRNLNS